MKQRATCARAWRQKKKSDGIGGLISEERWLIRRLSDDGGGDLA